MDIDKLKNASEVLSGLSWHLLESEQSALLPDGTLDRYVSYQDKTTIDAAQALLRDYTDPKNFDADTPVHKCWIDGLDISGQLTLEGPWRGGPVRIVRYDGQNGTPRANGADWRLVQRLYRGFLTELAGADARLVKGRSNTGDGSATNPGAEYMTLEWVGVDPDVVKTLADSKLSTNVISGLTYRKLNHDGTTVSVPLGHNWHCLTSNWAMEQDGSASVRFGVAKPEYTLSGFTNWLGSRQSGVTQYFDVPEALAQAILDAAKARGTDARATSYNRDEGLVSLTVTYLDLRGVSLNDVKIGGNCDQETTASFAWGIGNPVKGTMLVSASGTTNANGPYSEAGIENGKPYFEYQAFPVLYRLRYSGTTWILEGVDQPGNYYSNSDTDFPDEATGWIANGFSGPVPTITAVEILPVPDTIPAGVSYDRNVSENGDGGFSIVLRKRTRKYRNITQYDADEDASRVITRKEWKGVTDQEIDAQLVTDVAGKKVNVLKRFMDDCSVDIVKGVETPKAQSGSWTFKRGNNPDGTIYWGRNMDDLPAGVLATAGANVIPSIRINEFGKFDYTITVAPLPSSYSSTPNPFENYTVTQAIPDIEETATFGGLPYKRTYGSCVLKAAGNKNGSTAADHISDCNYKVSFNPMGNGRFFHAKGIKRGTPGSWVADGALPS